MTSNNYERVLESESFLSALGLPMIHRISLVRCYLATQLPWHEHPYYELLMLMEGAATYEFKSGRLVEMSGGQFMIVAPDTPHRGLHNVRRPAKICGMMISPSLIDSLQHTPFDVPDLDWMQFQFKDNANSAFKMSNRLKLFVQELSNKVAHYGEHSRQELLRLRIKICQVLYEVAKDFSCPLLQQQIVTMNSVVQFMRDHLDQPTCVDELADLAGCSRSKLFEVFKESTGMTPNDFWQRLRIERAYQRVLQTNDSITQIAMDCGFNTSQYFCTVFRKYWGLSPQQCRLRHRVAD